MTVLLPAIVPIAFIIVIGVIAGRQLSLDQQTLSQLTLYILIPALIIDNLYQTTISLEGATGLVAGFIVTSGILALLIVTVNQFQQSPSPVGKTLLVTTVFSNVGNLGLPVNRFAFGEQGLERAVICLIISSVLLFGVTPTILKGGNWRYGFRLMVKLPLFWAILAGLGFRLLSVEFPYRLDTGIQQLGEAAIPLALIILGMQLTNTRFRLGIYELGASGVRLVVAPTIALLVGILFSLDRIELQVLVMQMAMPTAVNTVLMADEFGGEADRAARTVVVSTLLSFVTIPLTLWLLTEFVA